MCQEYSPLNKYKICSYFSLAGILCAGVLSINYTEMFVGMYAFCALYVFTKSEDDESKEQSGLEEKIR